MSYYDKTFTERLKGAIIVDPKSFIVGTLFSISLLLFLGVILWAAFTNLPLWGTTLAVALILLLSALIIGEW